MSHMQAQDRDHAQLLRDSLLAELQHHNHAIVKIKARLNTLIPVSTIPPELLTAIFQLVVDRHTDNRLVSTSPPYAWLSLTHVCTHWREVALASPSLWSEILLPCRLQCIQMMLTRSQGVPLTVHHRIASSPLRRSEEYHSLEAALRCLFRIRFLTLYLPWEYYRKVSFLLSAPAPCMKELSLNTSNMLSCIGRSPPILSINHSLHPGLEKLDLSAYSVLWQGLATCHTLRHFSIDYAPFMRPTINTVAEVLISLRGLPLLETLKMSNVMLSPLPTSDGDDADHAVTLPNLQRLSLCGDATTISSLLDNIRHPRSTHLELDQSHIGDTELPRILPFIQSKLSGGSTVDSLPYTPFKTLAFGLDFKLSLLIRGWNAVLDMENEEEALDREVPDFHLELPRWSLEYPQIWDIIPLSEVRSLWVLSNLSGELSMSALSNVLSRMQRVSDLCLTDWSSRSVNDLLCGPAHRRALEANPNTSVNLVLPQLTGLVLRNVLFEACICHKEGHFHCLQDLGHILIIRARHGAPKVSRIVLMKCVHIIAAYVDSLKRTIPDVTWDGIERMRDDSSSDSDSGEAMEGYED